MITSLNDIHATLKSMVESHGVLDHRLSIIEYNNHIVGRVKLTPKWWLREERERRGTGVPVDLGLSVLWSSRNVGAKSGEQPGLYVGWGDVTGRQTTIDPQKYPSIERLNPSTQDIARHLWAETWRIPTRAEAQELIEKCQWFWTMVNGVPGFQVMGKTGNSIFLPAAGSRFGMEYEDAYYCGRLWTSDINKGDKNRAYMLEFCQMDIAVAAMGRHCGLNIRPVLEKQQL